MGYHVVVNHRRRGEPCPTCSLNPNLAIAHASPLSGPHVSWTELTFVESPVQVNRFLTQPTECLAELLCAFAFRKGAGLIQPSDVHHVQAIGRRVSVR